jgi:hypothetical protein
MLVRDINGRLHIINRKDCKDDKDFYQKIVKIRSEYRKYYKSVILISNSNSLSKKLL